MRERLGRRIRTWPAHLAPGLIAIGGFLLAWHWYAGRAAGDGLLLPTPIHVLTTLRSDWGIISAALWVTLGSAARGLAIGSAVAFVFAALAIAIPFLQAPLMRLLTVVFCIPLAAIAPLLFLLLDLPGPHVAMAAIAVVFPIYVALAQGLTARHEVWEDLRTVLGGGAVAYFFRVQVPSATREFLVAARIAGPAAVLGTTLAEYFGGVRGVGVLMINSLAQLNAPRAYALGAVITVVCVLAYLLVGLIERLLPWTKELSR